MSSISNATIAALMAILASLGIGGGGTSQLAAISGAGSGLVAHYTFDEGSGTTAGDSAGANTGTLTNGPTWTAGKIGNNSISFDGVNDYIPVANSSSINPSEITISLWVNPSQVASTKRLLNKSSSYYMRIKSGGYPEFIGSVFLTSTSIVPVNTWTHIIATGSASGHRIYINGILDTTSATPYTASADSQSLDIGGSLDFFSGSLDDVRIYNRALSAGEVAELYAYTGSGGGTPTPVSGTCGSSNNVCTTGTLSDTADTSSLYQWSCLGSGGGTTATCSLSIPPQTPSTYTLSITKSGTGSGTVTGGSINCGSTCSQSSISSGTIITLTASPSSGSTFTGWSGGNCSGTGTCTTTITANTAITSSFTSSTQTSTTCPSISQYGITWTFSTAVPCGQFVTGDWWVVGPVTVNSVSPGWDGSRHGSMIDPVPLAAQGFDSRINSYYPFSDANRTKFPVTITGNKSLLSAESLAQNKIGGAYQALKSMSILTILDSAPASNSFRPHFVSGTKKIWTTSDVNYGLVPNLPTPSGVTVPNVSGSLDRPNPYFGPGVWGTTIIPEDNVDDVYPAYENEKSSKLSLVVMLNIPQKQEYINRLVQRGIDHYAISLVNLNQWEANGGFSVGLKWPIIFAGILLNDSGMKSPPLYAPNIGTGSSYFKFSEDAYTYLGAPTVTYPGGKPGFGIDYTTLGYTIANCSSNCMARDPAGVWDPENNPSGFGGGYRQTVSRYWIGQTLAAYIMNAKSIWNHDLYFDYVDRWLSEPETWSDISDEYKRNVYGYGDETGFTKAMWATYRGAPPPTPTPISGLCSQTVNTCITGVLNDTADSSTQYIWQCLGTSGGASVQCSSSIPVVTTPTTPVTTPTAQTSGGSSSGGSSSPSIVTQTSIPTPSQSVINTIIQKQTTTTTTCKATNDLGRIIELFISLGIIKPDKVSSARTYLCSLAQPTTNNSQLTIGKFTLPLDIGARNTEVTTLQTYLIFQGLLFTKATGYFGPATAKAVGLFQQKYSLSTPGSASYGFVGPKTRAKLNELVK